MAMVWPVAAGVVTVRLLLLAGGQPAPQPAFLTIHRWGSAVTRPELGQPCVQLGQGRGVLAMAPRAQRRAQIVLLLLAWLLPRLLQRPS